jgi:hypothetical protein
MRIKTGLFAALAIAAISSPASAALTFYTTQASFQAAVPSATVIEDFEAFLPKDVGLATIVTPTITANPIAGGAGNVFVSSPGYNNYDPAGVLTTSSILTASGDEAFEVLLASAASAVGMNVYLNDFGPATLEYYSGATLLGSYTFTATPSDKTDNWVYFGALSSSAPITRFTWISTQGGLLNTGIDNIATGAIPEPSTWVLMLVGFGLAGAAMRRRHRQSLRRV